jgi:hypothetical protein
VRRIRFEDFSKTKMNLFILNHGLRRIQCRNSFQNKRIAMKRTVMILSPSVRLLLSVCFLISRCSSLYVKKSIPLIHRDVEFLPSHALSSFQRTRPPKSLKQSSIHVAGSSASGTKHSYPISVESTSTLYDPEVSQRPKTLPLLQSFALFCRYALKYWAEKNEERLTVKELRRARKSTGGLGNFLDSKSNNWNTVKQFYTSAKNLFKLVGYDAALLLPAGCFLVLGAVFESIRPHYWSKCISYVVSGEPHRSTVMNALVGLSVSNFLAALFTGLRGAMFWIAGTYTCHYASCSEHALQYSRNILT